MQKNTSVVQKLLSPPPAKTTPPPEPASTLPFSEDAEMCVLGSMLIDPEAAAIAIEEVKATDFYLGKHRIIFATFAEIFAKSNYLDELTVVEGLTRRALLEQAGGREYIGRLIVKTPSAAGIEDYCKIVLNYATHRQLLDAAKQIQKLAGNGSIDQAAAIIHDLSIQRTHTNAYSWGHAVKYDTENDPDALLGHRWLSKGGSCLWVGQTGMGKSSLNAQAAAVWALGLDFFGIKPTRPLRSLIIQAENDEGDIAEITRGISNGLKLCDRMEELQENIFFASNTAVAGDAFMPYARRLIDLYQPDLLWIDPLFAFCGCDVSDQGLMSKFLRLGLQKLAQDTGVCNMVVHHTNKPRAAIPGAPVTGEDAYSGSGTAEISNWARAVIRIKKLQAGDFELVAAKRGSRAGLKDSKGHYADSVFIKHAPRPDIYWLPAIEPENHKATAEADRATDCIARMDAEKFYTRTEIKELVAKELGKDLNYIGVPDRPAWRIWQQVMKLTVNQMGFYKRP